MYVQYADQENYVNRTIKNPDEADPPWLVCVIGLHAVQFGNNWMKKIQRTAKIGRGVGRVQLGCQRNFLNPIISKLDRHVVLLLIDCS